MSSNGFVSFYGTVSSEGLYGSFHVRSKYKIVDIFSLLETLSIEEQENLILRIQNNIKRLAELNKK